LPSEIPLDDPLASLMEYVAITNLLGECIISHSYQVPGGMVNPIRFTKLGNQMIEEVRQKHKRIRPLEVSLAVALAVGNGDEYYVDASLTDLQQLRKAISAEIVKGRILFPEQYSPSMAFDLFRVSPYSGTLNNRQTLAFLKGREIGTYQIGRSVVGPFGCLESVQARAMTPRTYVPGYLCESQTCRSLHMFELQTGDSGIVRARTALSEIERDNPATGPRQSALNFHIAVAKQLGGNPFIGSESLLNFIGDALDTDERAKVASRALRAVFKEDPGMRHRISSSTDSIIGDPSEFVESLSHARVMQVLHLLSDKTLVAACNAAVEAGEIRISPGEVRTARVERWPTTSEVEVGAHGVRFRPEREREGILLGHLLSAIYQESPQDLAFALGLPETTPLRDSISGILQSSTVDTIVDNCIVNSLSTAKAAKQLLSIEEKAAQTREELSALLKWRLGLSAESGASQSQAILGRIERYESQPQNRPEDQKRGDLSNIFVELETELMLALRFTDWALESDHYGSEYPFSFRLSELPAVDDLIQGSESMALAKPTLQPLAAALSKLAVRLQSLPAVERPHNDFPRETLATGRPFAFPHTALIHDLQEQSRSDILGTLKDCARNFGDENVLRVRNTGPAHGNSPFPSEDAIRAALSTVKHGIGRLVTSGLTPTVFEQERLTGRGGGQFEALYRSWSASHEIRFPEWPVAPGLPSDQRRMMIVSAAYGSGWGLLRFSVPRGDAGGPGWRQWPPRREADLTAGWGVGQQPETELAS
jgi:hypothetical protein